MYYLRHKLTPYEGEAMVAMAATRAAEAGMTMRALVRLRWRSVDDVSVDEIARPSLGDDRVLVRVRASSINKADLHAVLGTPVLARPLQGGILRPKSPLLGTDFAGVVEAVGKDVQGLQPGDEVFGGCPAAWAEYASAVNVVRKPANVSFEEAATAPIAGLTALQALRDKAGVQPGQKVLVNGASGGVGTFAVQIAKALGADVTAVCSTRNVELARSLGADRVIDYTQEDFTRGDERYDVLLDVTGSKPWHACRRILEPNASVVVIGAHAGRSQLGSLAKMVVIGRFSKRTVKVFIASFNKPDLQA